MAIVKIKERDAFAGCEACASYKNGHCMMERVPQRIGSFRGRAIYDCGAFSKAEEKPDVQEEKEPAVLVLEREEVTVDEKPADTTPADNAADREEEKAVKKVAKTKKAKTTKKK